MFWSLWLRPQTVGGLLSRSASIIRLVSRGCTPMVNMADVKRSPRVLSIQSHVVHGYVGNKSATFPLQLLGIDVDAINTVQFSNHTGYGRWKGQTLSTENLGDLLEGLAENGLDKSYTHILSGYSHSKSILLHVAKVVNNLRSKNQGLIYLCDPVIGDFEGGCYLPPDLIEVYRDTIVPCADIITPNQFEVEALTGKSVKSLAEAWEAVSILHTLGPKIVVVSSFKIVGDSSLYCLGSIKNGEKIDRAVLSFPKLPGNFVGTGDLFSALFLAWIWHTNQNIKESMELTIATIQAVLAKTGYGETVSQREISLIQSKVDIEKPKVQYFAHSV